MSRVLVTGGAGFIGSHVADELLKRGYDVDVMDNMSTGDILNAPGVATVYGVDIRSAARVMATFEERRYKYVFHLAAKTIEVVSHWLRRDIYENNIIGSANLINAAIETGVEHFVFATTLDAENPKPDPYGISKGAIEMDLQAAWNQFGLKSTSVVLSNVYGPRQCVGEVFRNVVGRFIQQLKAGQKMSVYGKGDQMRPFTYVEDVALAFVSIAGWDREGATRTAVISSYHSSVSRLAAIMAELWHGISPADSMDDYIEYGEERLNDPLELSMPERDAYDWTMLYDGLEKTIAWAKEAPLNEKSTPATAEIQLDIPKRWARELA